MNIPSELKDLPLYKLTQKEYGYDISELSQGSTKKIWHKCFICKQPKTTLFKDFVLSKCITHKECKFERRNKTCMQRYGVDNPRKSERIKKKIQQTWNEKYGVKHPSHIKDYREKVENTNLRKYGVKYHSQSELGKRQRRQTKLIRNTLKPKLVYKEYSKNYWLKQELNGCRINSNQNLPNQWSQGTPQKFEIICSCGEKWSPMFKDFTSGRSKSCGHFSQSQGEKQLGEYLEQLFPNQITSQDNLGFLKRQTVDYAVPELRLAFEYDGEQHFNSVRFGGVSEKKARDNFRLQQKRDRQKEKMIEVNDYYLIRIRYNQNVKQQLINELEKFILLD